MKPTVKQIAIVTAATAILIGANTAVFAHGGPGGGPGWGNHQGMMAGPGMHTPGSGWNRGGTGMGYGPQQGMMAGPRGMHTPGTRWVQGRGPCANYATQQSSRDTNADDTDSN